MIKKLHESGFKLSTKKEISPLPRKPSLGIYARSGYFEK